MCWNKCTVNSVICLFEKKNSAMDFPIWKIPFSQNGRQSAKFPTQKLRQRLIAFNLTFIMCRVLWEFVYLAASDCSWFDDAACLSVKNSDGFDGNCCGSATISSPFSSYFGTSISSLKLPSSLSLSLYRFVSSCSFEGYL